MNPFIIAHLELSQTTYVAYDFEAGDKFLQGRLKLGGQGHLLRSFTTPITPTEFSGGQCLPKPT